MGSKKTSEADINVKEFLKLVSIREVSEYDRKDLEKIIIEILKKYKINFSNKHVFEILKRCKNNLVLIENELKKLGILGEDLTNDLIDEVVVDYSTDKI
jgi:DNA polymerase III delta subunit